MVLILLLYKSFFDHLKTNKFPSHVIQVSKQDSVDIEKICLFYDVDVVNFNGSLIDLSNLEHLCKLLILYFNRI